MAAPEQDVAWLGRSHGMRGDHGLLGRRAMWQTNTQRMLVHVGHQPRTVHAAQRRAAPDVRNVGRRQFERQPGDGAAGQAGR